MPIPAIAYLRVSTRQQGESGLGLEAQQAAIDRFCASHDHKLVGTGRFIEVESGRKNARPELRRALAAARAHGAVLMVAKLDRLSRNAAFLLSLRDAGVEIVCCDMPQANRLVLGVMAMIAEWEADQIATRTREGLAAAKARGQRLGGHRGSTVSDDARRESARIRRRRAVAKARDALSQVDGWECLSASQLSCALNSAGIPTPARRGEWTGEGAKRCALMARKVG